MPDHDIVLFGATGFTGALVAQHLAAAGTERWAIAGRNRAKLEALDLGVPIIVADSGDAASLAAMARSTKVVCSTVGPYMLYGLPLLEACAEAGTDYCDITGETPFIRAGMDRFHERARETGARLVHCCGFDSIPSDLGVLMLQRHLEAQGDGLAEVRYGVQRVRGAASGGTIASMLNIMEQARKPEVRRILGHPYALMPEGERKGPDGSDQLGVSRDPWTGQWTGPFVMAAINTRVVRRSNALLDYAYGQDFRYAEVSLYGTGAKGFAKASQFAAGVAAFVGLASLGPSRALLKRFVLPAPGEGPDASARERGLFEIDLRARSRGGRSFAAGSRETRIRATARPRRCSGSRPSA